MKKNNNTILIIIGIIGAAILLFVFSKKNPGAIVATSYAEEPHSYGYEEEDCTGPCDIAQNEMACVQCELGEEESACYAECNIAKNDVACNQCFDELDYIPMWVYEYGQ